MRGSPADNPGTCSVIGSFRKRYAEAKAAGRAFESAGIRLLSPRKSEVVDLDELFVRLESDNPEHDDRLVQLIALHRILRSDFVYVVCPDGYLGRTTAYEIGRVVEWQIPLFFSDHPRDLPIPIGEGSVISADDLADRIRRGSGLPEGAPVSAVSEIVRLHESLLARRCLPEGELR